MSKRFLTGLILIAVTVVVLLLNSNGHVTLDFRLFTVDMIKAFAFLSFLVTGVVLGFLLR
jgi:hypothetical protein